MLVTGAQQGIGESMAIAFAEAGADVAVNWHDNEEKANSVAEGVSQFGNKVLLTKGDVPLFQMHEVLSKRLYHLLVVSIS